MRQDDHIAAIDRVHSALAGTPGEPAIGISFLSEPAVRALAWGARLSDPVVTVVCSRLRLDFAFVESWAGGASSTCERVVACGTVPLWVVRGPLGAVAEAHGWSWALAATVREPGVLALALDEAVEAAITSVRTASECGAGAVVVADDLVGEAGPLVAPDYVLDEIMPRYGRISRAAGEVGLPLIWHSDGDVRPFLAAARAEGIRAVHPGGLGPEEFRALHGCARQLGLPVLGGIPGCAVRDGVPAAIRAATSATLLARSGGLLVCDDGSVSTGEELGALIAALQSVRT